MRQALKRLERCLRGSGEESDEEKRRRYELNIPGIPGSLAALYDVQELVHEGVHGQLYSLLEPASGRRLVMKALWKSKQSFRLLDVGKRALAIPELKACQLRHDHVCRCFGFFESLDLFCVVTECCDGGSVRSLLQGRLRLHDHVVARIFSQALAAVVYLHSKRIVHRDLRPEQFLFASPRSSRLKLCDVLHAARPGDGQRLLDAAKPVVLLFAAPESLLKGEYSAKSDVWSAGCMFFELLYGYPPFTGEDRPLMRRIVCDKPDFSPLFFGASRRGVELLMLLLAKEPHERLTAAQASSHSWFTNAPEIGAGQRKADALRRQKLRGLMGQLHVGHIEEGQAGDDSSAAKMQEALLRGQYSRSLTGTLSQLSKSTPSDKEEDEGGEEDEEDEAALGHGREGSTDGGSGTDSEEDWQLRSARSDVESGLPPSGSNSHSDTYADASEVEVLSVQSHSRQNEPPANSPDGDEYRDVSTCWSEAEYSDWTLGSTLKRELDTDFKHWKAAVVEAYQAQSAEEVDSSGRSRKNAAEVALAGSRGLGSGRSQGGVEVLGREAASSRCGKDDAGSGGGGDGGQGVDAARQGSGFASSHSSDKLEWAARERSGSGSVRFSSSGAFASSSRESSSAPWEYHERDDLSTPSSTRLDCSHEADAPSKRVDEPGAAKHLAPIDECAELVETIGEITNRSLAHELHTAASSGVIVLSRRSNSSSSSTS